MARPSEYDFDLCIDICELIAQGQNIIHALESSEKYPSWPTFRRWKRQNEELRTLYINAQQDKAEALENEMDDYRNMLLTKEIDASTYNTLVQTLKWKMSKFYPKVFGEKLQHSNDPENPINISILNIDPLSDATNDSTS